VHFWNRYNLFAFGPALFSLPFTNTPSDALYLHFFKNKKKKRSSKVKSDCFKAALQWKLIQKRLFWLYRSIAIL